MVQTMMLMHLVLAMPLMELVLTVLAAASETGMLNL
jgi:hypothetical protein